MPGAAGELPLRGVRQVEREARPRAQDAHQRVRRRIRAVALERAAHVGVGVVRERVAAGVRKRLRGRRVGQVRGGHELAGGELVDADVVVRRELHAVHDLARGRAGVVRRGPHRPHHVLRGHLAHDKMRGLVLAVRDAAVGDQVRRGVVLHVAAVYLRHKVRRRHVGVPRRNLNLHAVEVVPLPVAVRHPEYALARAGERVAVRVAARVRRALSDGDAVRQHVERDDRRLVEVVRHLHRPQSRARRTNFHIAHRRRERTRCQADDCHQKSLLHSLHPPLRRFTRPTVRRSPPDSTRESPCPPPRRRRTRPSGRRNAQYLRFRGTRPTSGPPSDWPCRLCHWL